MFLLIVAIYLGLFYTRWGLRVRAVGEHPLAADTVGIRVLFTRYRNVVLGGIVAGIGGAYFTLGSVGRFDQDMTGGRGFIGLAAMIFGRWNPIGAFLAAPRVRLRGLAPDEAVDPSGPDPLGVPLDGAVRRDHPRRGGDRAESTDAGCRRPALREGVARDGFRRRRGVGERGSCRPLAAIARARRDGYRGELTRRHGGKGANQAAAAARLGARTWLVGATGDDDLGRDARKALEAEGIDLT